jgi:IS5 family transposase
LLEKAEQLTASDRAKVEHPFRLITCQFGFTTVCCTGLAKNTAQLIPLFALSNVWLALRQVLGARG